MTTDLFLESKRRGCAHKLEVLEGKLLEWETKSTLSKLAFRKHIEKLQSEYEDYKKLYAKLNQKYNKKMHRVVLRQDAWNEIRDGAFHLKDAWNAL